MKPKTNVGLITHKILWVSFFCYATCAALIFQKLILPMIPSLHADSGLLMHDAILFHTEAINLADQIRESGWSNWSLWPARGCGANVAVLSILYVFFGPDPSLVIPINAVLHASSGLLIYFIAQAICPGRVGHYAGLVVSVLFIVFPSSLNWYAQIHKDGYAILGLLLVLYSWVKWTSIENYKNKLLLFLAGNLLGIILLLSVRSYAVAILFLAILLLFLINLFSNLINKKMQWRTIVGGASAILFIGLLVIAVNTYKLGTDIDHFTSTEVLERITKKCSTGESWEWQSDDIFPAKLGEYAKAVTKIRLVFICSAYESNSIQDRHIAPENIVGIIQYLPRALQIALFAPFPDTWFKEASITKIVGSVEIFIWYLLAPGIILLLWQRPIQQVWIALGFVFVFVIVYAYVITNLGTLHRIRYPFIMILMLLGAMGWYGTLLKHLHSEKFKKRQSDST